MNGAAGDRSGGSWVTPLPCIRFREYFLIRARAGLTYPVSRPSSPDTASHQRISGRGQPLAWVIGTHLIVVACSPPLRRWGVLVHDSPTPGLPWGPAEGLTPGPSPHPHLQVNISTRAPTPTWLV